MGRLVICQQIKADEIGPLFGALAAEKVLARRPYMLITRRVFRMIDATAKCINLAAESRLARPGSVEARGAVNQTHIDNAMRHKLAGDELPAGPAEYWPGQEERGQVG